jgi:hypothetical protein
VIVFGMAGALLERGGPPSGAPGEQLLAFVSTYRRELLAQSLMFVFGAAAYLSFFAALRTTLARSGESSTLATVAFGAGIVAVVLQLLLQILQLSIATADPDIGSAVAGLIGSLMWNVSVAAYVPLAIMFVAVWIATRRDHVFPPWLGWLSAVTGIVHLIMSFGLVVRSGPLAPGGALTYGLYALSLAWLLAATSLMVFRNQGTPMSRAPGSGEPPRLEDP